MGKKNNSSRKPQLFILEGERLQFVSFTFPDVSTSDGRPFGGGATQLKFGGFLNHQLQQLPYIPGYIQTSKRKNIFSDKECVNVKLEGFLRAPIINWDDRAIDERVAGSVYPKGHSTNYTVYAASNWKIPNSPGACSCSSGGTYWSDTILVDLYHSGMYHVDSIESPPEEFYYPSLFSGCTLFYKVIEIFNSVSEQRIAFEVTVSRCSETYSSRKSFNWQRYWADPPYSSKHPAARKTMSFTMRGTLSLRKSGTYPNVTLSYKSYTYNVIRWSGRFEGASGQTYESSDPTLTSGSLTASVKGTIFSTSPLAADSVSAVAERFLRRADVEAWRDVANCQAAGEYQWASQAAVGAVDNTHIVDTNSIDFLRDLPSLLPSVRDALKDIRDIRKGRVTALADLYLIFKYCWSTTLSDAKAYRKAVNSRIKKTKGAMIAQGRCPTLVETFGQDTITRDSWVKLYYSYCDIGKLSKVYKAFWQWGLFPTAKNIWDLVPFSFVVDWFLSLDDLIASIDHKYGSTYIYNVESVIQTFKCVHTHAQQFFPDNSIAGEVHMTTYVRRVLSELPPMPLWTPSPSSLSTHWWEGTALFIQRMK